MKKVVALAACVLLSGCFTYSIGERAGTITKFSQKGIVCKTWEGELAMAGFKLERSTSVTANTGNVFEFTVEDEAVVHQIKAALEDGRKVRVQYRQELFASPCRSSSKGAYFVTGVQVVG